MTELSASLYHFLSALIDIAGLGVILFLFPLHSWLRYTMQRFDHKRELEMLEYESKVREIRAKEIASLLGNTEAN